MQSGSNPGSNPGEMGELEALLDSLPEEQLEQFIESVVFPETIVSAETSEPSIPADDPDNDFLAILNSFPAEHFHAVEQQIQNEAAVRTFPPCLQQFPGNQFQERFTSTQPLFTQAFACRENNNAQTENTPNEKDKSFTEPGRTLIKHKKLYKDPTTQALYVKIEEHEDDHMIELSILNKAKYCGIKLSCIVGYKTLILKPDYQTVEINPEYKTKIEEKIREALFENKKLYIEEMPRVRRYLQHRRLYRDPLSNVLYTPILRDESAGNIMSTLGKHAKEHGLAIKATPENSILLIEPANEKTTSYLIQTKLFEKNQIMDKAKPLASTITSSHPITPRVRRQTVRAHVIDLTNRPPSCIDVTETQTSVYAHPTSPTHFRDQTRKRKGENLEQEQEKHRKLSPV